MAIEAEGFVLGEDEDAAEFAVEAVGEGGVNDAVDAAEGHGGLGTVAGEGPEAFALPSGEEHADGIAHINGGHRHRTASRRGGLRLATPSVAGRGADASGIPKNSKRKWAFRQ